VARTAGLASAGVRHARRGGTRQGLTARRQAAPWRRASARTPISAFCRTTG